MFQHSAMIRLEEMFTPPLLQIAFGALMLSTFVITLTLRE